MQVYNFIFLVTIPLYGLALYFLCRAFWGDRVTTRKTETITYVLFSVLLGVLFFITRIPTVFLVFSILSYYLISLNYTASVAQRVMGSLLIYATFFIIEALSWRAVGVFPIHAFSHSNFDSVAGILLNRILALILARLFYRYNRTKVKLYPIPTYYYIAHILILAGTVFMFASSLEKDTLTMGQVLLSGMVMITVNGMVLFLDEKIYQSIVTSHEKISLRQQNEAYEKQTEFMKQSTATIQSLKHDMKNHILALNAIYEHGDTEEFQKYVRELLVDIGDGSMLIQSGNYVIDSIVNFKLQNIQEQRVDLQLQVNVPQKLPIVTFDLAVLLGNLLDNAVTAVGKEGEEKTLSLYMDCSKGSLILLLDNWYSGYLLEQNGRFQSTKSQPHLHGIGLMRVKEVVNKYEGTIDIDYTQDLFSVAVVLPLQHQD